MNQFFLKDFLKEYLKIEGEVIHIILFYFFKLFF